MAWAHPSQLLWIVPAVVLVHLATRRSQHAMGTVRRRWLLAVRCTGMALVVCVLAGPSCSTDAPVAVVLDSSASISRPAIAARAREVLAGLPARPVAIVSAAAEAELVPAIDATRSARDTDTNLESAIALASTRLQAGGRVIVLSDGLETRGVAVRAARQAAARGIRVDCVAVAGEKRRDARLVRLRRSASRVHQGAPFTLMAEVRATLPGDARVVLLENDTEVASHDVVLTPGRTSAVRFERTLETGGTYRYTARVEADGDVLRANDVASTSVQIEGRTQVLILAGQRGEGRLLARALAASSMDVDTRIPPRLDGLDAFDAVILANVPAFDLPTGAFEDITAFVARGGALLMVGGPRSFGAGGYHGTSIADLLPVDVRPRERDVTALVLVLDRSGSMRGEKMNLCRSAALAAAETLRKDDRIGIVAFDVEPRWIAPLMPAGESESLRERVATLDAAGGTHILPAMAAGIAALRGADARVKHMIVLSDGRTQGGAYAALARKAAQSRITISTVGVGAKADRELLATIAALGGGRHYATHDASDLPRIFTADTAKHAGDLVRETRFTARVRDRHPMLAGWDPSGAGSLAGYVRTEAKPTASVSLLAKDDDPLLAHWRRGHGVVVAFTADAAPRWASGWLAQPAHYRRFWCQVVRDAARASDAAAAPTAFSTSPSKEQALGRVDADRLRAIARAGGGALFEEGTAPPRQAARTVDPTPWLLQLFLVLFLLDLGIRRWENLEGTYAATRDRLRGGPA